MPSRSASTPDVAADAGNRSPANAARREALCPQTNPAYPANRKSEIGRYTVPNLVSPPLTVQRKIEYFRLNATPLKSSSPASFGRVRTHGGCVRSPSLRSFGRYPSLAGFERGSCNALGIRRRNVIFRRGNMAFRARFKHRLDVRIGTRPARVRTSLVISSANRSHKQREQFAQKVSSHS
jgi:hypothetical protein